MSVVICNNLKNNSWLKLNLQNKNDLAFHGTNKRMLQQQPHSTETANKTLTTANITKIKFLFYGFFQTL